jgi:hypothetical protein
MALFNANRLEVDQLTNESLSVTLVSDGYKALHITTVIQCERWRFDRHIFDCTVITGYEITFKGTLETYSDLQTAIERYNDL